MALEDMTLDDILTSEPREVDVNVSLAFTVPPRVLPALIAQIMRALPLSSSIEVESREVTNQPNRSE